MERNLLLFFVLFLSFSASSCSAYFSGNVDSIETLAVEPTEGVKVYLVTVEWHKGQDIKQFAIRTLTSILTSEAAAKKALVYVYSIFPGFAAKLNFIEASKLEKQPGILQVIPETTYNLMH